MRALQLQAALAVALTATLVAVASAAAPSPCDQGWTFDGGRRCLRLTSDRFLWGTQPCKDLKPDAELATVTDTASQAAMGSFLKWNGNVWVGLNAIDSQRDSSWKYLDGLQYDWKGFDLWAPNHPSSKGGDCAYMGGWECRYKTPKYPAGGPYLCEDDCARKKYLLCAYLLTTPPPCPSPWTYIPAAQHCMYVSQQEFAFADAEAQCKAVKGGAGSTLASVYSAQELEAIKEFIKGKVVWVGLKRDAAKTAKWRWSDGTAATVFPGMWRAGSPTGDGVCAVMAGSGGTCSANTGELCDEDCSARNKHLCQYFPSIPPTGFPPVDPPSLAPALSPKQILTAPATVAQTPQGQLAATPLFQSSPAFTALTPQSKLAATPLFQSSPAFSALTPQSKFAATPLFQSSPAFSALTPQSKFAATPLFQSSPAFTALTPHSKFAATPLFQSSPAFTALTPQSKLAATPLFQSSPAFTVLSPAFIALTPLSQHVATPLFQSSPGYKHAATPRVSPTALQLAPAYVSSPLHRTPTTAHPAAVAFSPAALQAASERDSSDDSDTLLLVIAVLLGVLVLVCFGLVIFFYLRTRRKDAKSGPEDYMSKMAGEGCHGDGVRELEDIEGEGGTGKDTYGYEEMVDLEPNPSKSTSRGGDHGGYVGGYRRLGDGSPTGSPSSPHFALPPAIAPGYGGWRRASADTVRSSPRSESTWGGPQPHGGYDGGYCPTSRTGEPDSAVPATNLKVGDTCIVRDDTEHRWVQGTVTQVTGGVPVVRTGNGEKTWNMVLATRHRIGDAVKVLDEGVWSDGTVQGFGERGEVIVRSNGKQRTFAACRATTPAVGDMVKARRETSDWEYGVVVSTDPTQVTTPEAGTKAVDEVLPALFQVGEAVRVAGLDNPAVLHDGEVVAVRQDGIPVVRTDYGTGLWPMVIPGKASKKRTPDLDGSLSSLEDVAGRREV